MDTQPIIVQPSIAAHHWHCYCIWLLILHEISYIFATQIDIFKTFAISLLAIIYPTITTN
jgi:hypothetical protein